MDEIEVKLEVDGADEVLAALAAAGARLVGPRHFEDNRLFDRPDGALATEGRLLRLRVADGRAVLGAKGPADPEARAAGIKRRREVEVAVPPAEADALVALLETAGLAPCWRYQKWRTTWSLAGATIVLDELPCGVWVEIEGSPPAIDAAARLLGRGPADYRALTYHDVFSALCAARGEPVGDLVFGPGDGA